MGSLRKRPIFHKPMLAKNYESQKAKVAMPCYLQPKLDGIRCVTDGRRFWSRNGKRFPTKNIRHLQLLAKLPYLVDGELFIPRAPFEDIVSGLKNASTVDRRLARKIKFCVFDVMTDEPFEMRTIAAESVSKVARAFGAKWQAVQTFYIRRAEYIPTMTQELVKRGHEGSMVRTAKGKYVHGRTHHLLKLKPLKSAEFRIMGVKEAKGKDRGTPIFVCCVGKPKDKVLFRARPMGTTKQRRQMWRDRRNLIGQPLTVEYQNLTKHGVPRFPRAKVLRDYE